VTNLAARTAITRTPTPTRIPFHLQLSGTPPFYLFGAALPLTVYYCTCRASASGLVVGTFTFHW